MSDNNNTFKIPDWLKPKCDAPEIVSLLDEVVEKIRGDTLSHTETDLLNKAFWSQGQAIRLREDTRFFQTPWGNWLLADDSDSLMNDWLYDQFIEGKYLNEPLEDCLLSASNLLGMQARFCPADKRFVLRNGQLSLNAQLLSGRPKLSDDPGDEKFVSFLPFYALEVIAASEPAGEWGAAASGKVVQEPLVIDAATPDAWIKVVASGVTLKSNMFVSRIYGHSMDDGKRGIIDGSLALFEYWPKGSRQNKIVLVRGAFDDPETGSYALKQYQADQRNADGEHREIILHSLNQDKTQYPDIILQPNNDDDVTVIAELINVLADDEYAREPKPKLDAGQRDIHCPDNRKQLGNKLKGIHERFFSSRLDDVDKTNDSSSLSWVCLAAEEDGPCLEILPLTFLPKFIKRLQLSDYNNTKTLLASNYRRHKKCESVTLGAAQYLITPPEEFSEDFDDEFLPWRIDGLTPDSLHWFRVDASGIGRLVSGASWSSGNIYRGLALAEKFHGVPDDIVMDVGNGWSLIEFEVTDAPPEWLTNLIKFDKSIQRAPLLSWVKNSPTAWEITHDQNELPVFTAQFMPVLSISLPEDVEQPFNSDVLLLLHNGEKTTSLLLQSNNSWVVEFDGLMPSSYVVQAIPMDKRLSPQCLAFYINGETKLQPAFGCFELQGSSLNGDVLPQSSLIKEHDWYYQMDRAFFASDLVVKLPPYWTLRVILHSSVFITHLKYRADENGLVDLCDVLIDLQPHLESLAAGRITLDAADFGQIELQHHKDFSLDVLQPELESLWATFNNKSRQILDDTDLLTQVWLKPLFNAWGGRLDVNPDEALLNHDDSRCLYRWVNCVWDDDKVLSQGISVLLITEGCDEKFTSNGRLRSLCEDYMKVNKQRRMFITDGLKITELRRRSRVNLRWFSFETIINDKSQLEMWQGELEGGGEA